MTPWRLEEITYSEVKANPPFDVAVLPFGATEPHNLHLPYGTDTFQVEAIAEGVPSLTGRCASCSCRRYLMEPRPTR